MSSENPDTRTRILKATGALLEGQKASAVRMSDIAREARLSRQAVYLHFPNRAELLIAAVRYLDDVKCAEDRFEACWAETDSVRRLDAFVEAWGNYMPEIWGVASALLAMRETDEAAAAAWDDRMAAVHRMCAGMVEGLHADGRLTPELSPDRAADVLWGMLSIRSWELARFDCGWDQGAYIETAKLMARRVLLADP